MKRYLTLIFALLLILALPLAACGKKNNSEQEQQEPSEGLQYISTGAGTCYLSGLGVCADTHVIVPAKSPAGDTVTGVGREAFKDCKTITGVVLPEGVVNISTRAFAGCTSLKTVQIPNSITSLGMEVFDGCTALQYNGYGNAAYLGNAEKPYLVLFKAAATTIKQCVIQETTKVIYPSAFKGCSELRMLTLPQGITHIGNQAFSGAGITGISIPSGVTKIELGTFYECIHLTAVEIPAGVTEIATGAFAWCTALAQVTLPEGVATVADQAFSNCVRLTDISIPKSVTSIGSNVFSNCASLKNVFYAGTQAEWGAVALGAEWDGNMDSYVVHCTDGDITK